MTQQRWSYRIVELKASFLGRVTVERIQEELDKAGAQGWKLVSAPVIGSGSSTGGMRLFFKRPQ